VEQNLSSSLLYELLTSDELLPFQSINEPLAQLIELILHSILNKIQNQFVYFLI